jgi:hypothetical protein
MYAAIHVIPFWEIVFEFYGVSDCCLTQWYHVYGDIHSIRPNKKICVVPDTPRKK